MRLTTFVLVLAATWPALAAAQPSRPAPQPSPVGTAPAPQPAAPAESPPAGPAEPAPVGALTLSVELEAVDVSRDDILIAIARELKTAVASTENAPQMRVRVSHTRGITVIYRNPAGTEWLRAMPTPAAQADIPEAIALLVGNLARDEASLLLPAPSPPPPQRAEPKAAKRAPQPKPDPTGSAPPAPPASETAAPDLRYVPFNASLFHPVAIRPSSHQERVAVELGLFYSYVGAQDGFGLSLGLLRTAGASRGLQLALVNYQGGGAQGVHVTHLADVTGGDLHGASLAGALSWVGGASDGLLAAGLATVSLNGAVGAHAAGALSYSGGAVAGLQAAGLGNIAVGDVQGAQLGGFGNITTDKLVGAQLSGFGNIAVGSVSGAQVSGAYNHAGNLVGAQLSGAVNYAGDVSGAQIGLVNVGGHVTGTQVGLVNVAQKLDGVAVGLFSYAKGQMQVASWYSGTLPVNVGLRLQSGYIYTMPTLGWDPRTSDQPLATGFSFGGRIPLPANLFIDLETNASALVDANDMNGATAMDLRYRGMAGYQATPWFGLFAGVSFRHRVIQNDTRAANVPEFTAGIQLL